MKPKHINTLLSLSLLLYSGPTSAQQLSKEQNQQLLQAQQGDISKINSLNLNQLPQINYKKTILPGPRYIISDDPEYIRVPEAIALQEQLEPGNIRFYLYNVNGVVSPKKMDRKITAVLKNTGNSPMHIRMLKYSSQKPSTNYFKVGKQGLADYFASAGQKNIRTIKPGEAISLDEQLEKQITRYDELVHGFYEFVIDQRGELSVLQTAPEISGPQALKKISNILPSKSQSGAGRGTYGISNYLVEAESTLDTKNGITELTLADGNKDPWITGREGHTGAVSTLSGNYGVMYDIRMKWKSTDGKGLALVTWNSRSSDNKWCNGMAASMVVSKGKFEQGIIQLPKNELVTKGAPELVLIQLFTPEVDGKEQEIKLTYSPPGASCLPTPLVFIPVDLKP